MLFAQILINGILYSQHRYPSVDREHITNTIGRYIDLEHLHGLGRVETRIYTKAEFEDIVNA